MTGRIVISGQTAFGVDADTVADLVEVVLGAAAGDARAAAAEGAGDVSLTVAFVDEPTMTSLNERFRGVEGPTDVLSFVEESDDWPGGGGAMPRELGEIAVCLPVVQRYALEEGDGVGRRLAWTLIHGVLHLLGYDHEVDGGEMRAREQALLAGLDEEVFVHLFSDRGG